MYRESDSLNISVGGVRAANPLFLAPMASVTTAAVRRLAVRLGAGLTHTEMSSATGLVRGGRQTLRVLDQTNDTRPLVAQLFAGDAESRVRGAEVAQNSRPLAPLGNNMACPMPKVLKRGAGSALLDRPDEAASMVRELCRFGFPVWPKVRKEPAGSGITTEEFVQILFEAGASCVAVHGRTPGQRYEGQADRKSVKELCRAFPGRILASGDVFTAEDVLDYLSAGAGAVLLARGFIADPFIVPRSLDLLSGRPETRSSLASRYEIFCEFAGELERLHGPKMALGMVKRFAPGFFKFQAGAGALRRTLGPINDWNEMQIRLDEWFGQSERGKEHARNAAELDG